MPDESMYVAWNKDDQKARAAAINDMSGALNRVEPVVRTAGTNIYQNIAPQNVSVRDGMNRSDYNSFRPDATLPTKPKDKIRASIDAYENIGLIHNIFDLMSDFATQGIDIHHPNERIEKWHKEWFRKVRGKERSERFINNLYKSANVIVKRQTALLPAKQEEEMKRSRAKPELDPSDKVKLAKREIPWKYKFLNPLSLDIIAEELSLFVGQDDLMFAVAIPKSLTQKILHPKNQRERELIDLIPKDIKAAAKKQENSVPLDPKTIRAFYYKRDDWQTWATPMINSILSDLQILQKMKLADLAALDGAISCIRVWKLGNIEAGILPTPAAINRLAEMLCNNVGGGVMDLVWGPEIDLIETSTEVHKFLGNTKYEPVLTAIYAGLGIPPTLTGAATENGFTNNFISLKTLTERLQYGRDLLVEFWEEELRMIQKSMGFRFPATMVFDRMVLSDEAAEKALLIQLADRDIISWELVVERFGEVPEIEESRLRREERKRDKGQMPRKVSPYHADKEHEYKKGFQTQGLVTPSELGLELKPRKSGEKSMIEHQDEREAKKAEIKSKNKVGVVGEGRPKTSKDSKKRKQKRVLPRSSAEFLEAFTWAENAQARISQVCTPAFLSSLNKKNLRELTNVETKNFENYKFFLLCQFNLGDETTEAAIQKATAKQLVIPEQVSDLLKTTIAKHIETTGKEPTLEVLRRFQSGAFALWKGDFSDEASDSDDGL